MSVPPRLSIVTLGVADVARATEFYESLGWQRSSASLPSITFFSLAGSVLALFERGELAADAGVDEAGSGFRGVALALNCDSREQVGEVFAAWCTAGATPVKQPEEVFWGGYSSYVADPDGHLWEIVHNPYAGFDAEGRLQMP